MPSTEWKRSDREAWHAAIRAAWREYRPLDETPDLFLKFARLHKAPDFVAAALDWSVRYGVSGGSSLGSVVGYDITPLALFWEEAKRAWVILTMYEAALNDDPQLIRFLLSEYRDETLELYAIEGVYEDDNEWCLDLGLRAAIRGVEGTVQELCEPILIVEKRSGKRWFDPTHVQSAWHFKNLLGAMYLQMFWLMALDGDLARCEYCRRVISLARSHPEGRKRRQDRRFCDDACHQAHHRNKKKG